MKMDACNLYIHIYRSRWLSFIRPNMLIARPLCFPPIISVVKERHESCTIGIYNVITLLSRRRPEFTLKRSTRKLKRSSRKCPILYIFHGNITHASSQRLNIREWINEYFCQSKSTFHLRRYMYNNHNKLQWTLQ